MEASYLLRMVCLAALGLMLTACEDGWVIDFAQPFPMQAADMAAFPARHRAVYTATDSGKSLCIGRTAVWRQELQKMMLGRRQLDSLHHRLSADSAYQDEHGRHHYLRLVGKDSVRDSWLWCDTIFTLAGPNAGRLRRFQGRYYLNIPDESAGQWLVQRLEISDPNLTWQTLGNDTTRLLALDPAMVRYHRNLGVSYFQLAPAPGPQTRHVGRYAGLWETQGEYKRRH